MLTPRTSLALLFIELGYVAGWYCLVLVTSPPSSRFPRRPTQVQLWGLVFACILAGLSWGYKTLIFDDDKQDN